MDKELLQKNFERIREELYNGKAQLENGHALVLTAAVLAWASTEGEHGGNPYTKPMVALAQELYKQVVGEEF